MTFTASPSIQAIVTLRSRRQARQHHAVGAGIGRAHAYRKTLAAGLLLGLGWWAASSASAQTLQPGLWEITQKMQSSSGQMEQQMAEMNRQLAAMPPEQRKMMEAMMAQNGVGMAGGAGGAMAIRMCFTKEMVERNELPAQEGDCKTTVSPRTGNTMKMRFVCTKPPSNGEGEMTFVSAQAYTSRMTVNTTANGKSEKVTMNSSGKWLSANCGSVKPIPQTR